MESLVQAPLRGARRWAPPTRRGWRAALCGLLLCATVAMAQTPKTLHVAFPVAETGIDPQAVGDTYSFALCYAIFDPLYRYDYFARPARIVPNTAQELPHVSDGGRTYTVRLRPGIHFAPDPAFGGRARELTADDYVYSIKRIFDPKVRSYWLYLFENHLAGLDAVLASARRTGRFDYDAKIEGLQAIDRYTLRIRFNEPDYVFVHWLTNGALAAVAREVVEAHKDASNRVMDYPVGTGPYRLAEWVRGQKLVLEANPNYRTEIYPVPGAGSEPGDAAIALSNRGKRLPIVQRVEVNIIEEAQPRLLSFESGALDYLLIPGTVAGTVLDGASLKPELARRGMRLHRQIEPAIDFTFFNLDDPVVGGYSNEKIALRRAMAMGYDRDAYIKLLLNGQAVPATQPVPPGLLGHDPKMPLRNAYDPAGARALLDRFGYRDRDGDGYREQPDGKPLTIVKASTTANTDRDADALWKRSMDAIGVRITFLKNKWPELNKMSEAGQLQMWNLGWISPMADGDTFYSLFYSANIGTSNDARLRLAEYDRTYEAARKLPDGPERNALYRKLAELVLNYVPWVMVDYAYGNTVTQPWLRGYKLHPFRPHQWEYYDVAR